MLIFFLDSVKCTELIVPYLIANQLRRDLGELTNFGIALYYVDYMPLTLKGEEQKKDNESKWMEVSTLSVRLGVPGAWKMVFLFGIVING